MFGDYLKQKRVIANPANVSLQVDMFNGNPFTFTVALTNPSPSEPVQIIGIVGKRLQWRCDRLPLMLAPQDSASVAIRAKGPKIPASRAAEFVAYCEANQFNSPFHQSIPESLSFVSSEGDKSCGQVMVRIDPDTASREMYRRLAEQGSADE
jgi:hypothetical protein